MVAIFRRAAAWYRNREETGKRRHLAQSLALTAEESRRLGHPQLSELLYLVGDFWVDGYGDRALAALERESREINRELRFGPKRDPS